MAKTNNDSIEEARPPAWDLLTYSWTTGIFTRQQAPPGIFRSWAPTSGRSNRAWGKKGSKATVSTHPKYSARLTSDLFYLCTLIKGRLYMWTDCRNARIEGKA